MKLLKLIKNILIWLPATGSVIESVLVFMAYFKILPGAWDTVALGLGCLTIMFAGFALTARLYEKKDLSIKELVD